MRLIIAAVLFSCCFSCFATHIVGGHIEVQQTDFNQYSVKLVILRDCGSGNQQLRNAYSFRVFQLSDSSFTTHTFLTGPAQRIQIGDPCFSPPGLCLEQYEITGIITLPPDSVGYVFAAQEFARNYLIENILSDFQNQKGMTWVTEFPGNKEATQNSSPLFPPISGNSFLCINNFRSLDLSATDPDGDSLAYQLEVPYDAEPGANNNNQQPLPGPPPYNPVQWRPGYSLTNVIPGNPPLSIDPVSGELSVQPNLMGVFVVTYAVSEFRNGKKIGEVRRDIQLEVLSCEINELPVFQQPQESSFTISVEDEFCVDVRVRDANDEDSIYLSSDYSLATNLHKPDINLINALGIGSVGGKICWKPSCSESINQQQLQVDLMAVSEGCDATDTVRKSFTVSIEPLPEDITRLFPNIFTPNNDGINDVFTLTNELVYPCLKDLEIRIFNRWGTEVYHNKLDNRFGWDGNYNGQQAAAGTYFYVVSGRYPEKDFSRKGFLTLIR